MSLMTKKYGVSVSFYHKMMFFGKTEGNHLWILSQNLNFFKSRKSLYRGPLCLSDREYEIHGQKI
jgi:hypothetical protein